eukprot:712080-Amphidinium_carterae.1
MFEQQGMRTRDEPDAAGLSFEEWSKCAKFLEQEAGVLGSPSRWCLNLVDRAVEIMDQWLLAACWQLRNFFTRYYQKVLSRLQTRARDG